MKMSELLSEKDMGKHNNATTGFKALAKKAGGGEKGAKIAGAQFQKMKKAGQLEEQDVVEMRDRRDAYQRDYDSSVSNMGRQPRDWDEGNTEPPNNFAIYINGKKWKVLSGRGTYADDHREKAQYQQLRDMCAKKSEATGKKWTVHATGENPTSESVAESATAGATSAANIGTVDAPHISPGKARGKKSYIGSPSTGSGTKAPPQPKVVQPKTKAGTAVNGLDIKGKSLFGGPANEAAVIKRR